MSLAPGTRLGPYEIAVQIGVGGMGEVYRATDTHLGRQVAIKVLPESITPAADGRSVTSGTPVAPPITLILNRKQTSH